MQYCNMY